MRVARVDCIANGELCSAHGVKGFPMLKLFRSGALVCQRCADRSCKVEDYFGDRSLEALVTYVTGKLDAPSSTTATATAPPVASGSSSASSTEGSRSDEL